jgi:Flp pilus assembly protein TadG
MNLHVRRNASRFLHARRGPFRRGGAILEAALVLPILLALSFGMIEYGYFFFLKHTLQGAARDGARIAIVPNGTNAKITSTVAASMQAAGLENSGYQVEIQNGSTSGAINVATVAAQTPIKVVVHCNWSAVSSGLRPMGLIDGAKQVSGTAVMIKE